MDLHASAEPGPFTWEDFVCLEEDDLRELIDGDLVEVEVPRQKHEHVVAMLAMFLGVWGRGRGHRVLASGYKVKISGKRGFMPDLQVFRAENRADREQQEGLEHGHPDLVVEVLSPSSARYDRVTKLGGYSRPCDPIPARAGASEGPGWTRPSWQCVRPSRVDMSPHVAGTRSRGAVG